MVMIMHFVHIYLSLVVLPAICLGVSDWLCSGRGS